MISSQKNLIFFIHNILNLMSRVSNLKTWLEILSIIKVKSTIHLTSWLCRVELGPTQMLRGYWSLSKICWVAYNWTTRPCSKCL